MFGKARGTVAIDLGSGQVKMLTLENGSGTPRIGALGIERLHHDAIVGGEIMDYRVVVDAVRALRERLGIKGRAAATAVSGRDVIVKRIKMDRMRDAEARKVIRWEAEQHVPFDMDSVSLDFEVLDPDSDGLQMDVLLVAAKMDLVETRMRLLEEAGFDTAVIDVDSFAVQTAFEKAYDHAAYGSFCLVNIGREISNLSVVEQTSPVLTRDLAIGTRRFAEALVKELGISLEDAETRLQQPGEMDAASRDALKEPIESLVAPVERARSILMSGETSQGRLDEVVLSGGGARLPGLGEAIERRLGTKVTVLDPLRAVAATAEVERSLAEYGGSSVLAVAVGLGLRGKE
ncbi:MAG TPA: type IV pilus assembly protein PilM [Gemmatimonadota bacterium]|jgi:type IV pilus assembly protein PilM|nr:type IV pilus assembly protein PilM [Gemmatimonadota bacterium]